MKVTVTIHFILHCIKDVHRVVSFPGGHIVLGTLLEGKPPDGMLGLIQ